MKRTIAITLTLVMVLFVGCGLANQLEGTKWEMLEAIDYESGTAKIVYDFQKEGKFVMTVIQSMPESSLEQTISMNGTWSVDGDQLTVSWIIDGETIATSCAVEIDGDVLRLTLTEDGETNTMTLNRVK